MYEPRFYRDNINSRRFNFTRIVEEETDLWVGTGKEYHPADFSSLLTEVVLRIRNELKAYIRRVPDFITSHDPVKAEKGDSVLIQEMKIAGQKAQTGPMAAVAGVVAQRVANALEAEVPDTEILIENGGDIYLRLKDDLVIQPLVVRNPGFKNLSLRIPGEFSHLSVCSSSGKFGHSHSYGTADLVSVFAGNAALCDAWATSLANRIHTTTDLNEFLPALPEDILAVLAVKDDLIWYRGPFEFVSV